MIEPRPVSELLRGFLKETGQKRRRQVLQDAVATAVGPAAEANCRVAGCRGGRLVIEVGSAPLFAELRGFRAEEIRRRINEVLGRPEVVSILFRMGGTAHV